MPLVSHRFYHNHGEAPMCLLVPAGGDRGRFTGWGSPLSSCANISGTSKGLGWSRVLLLPKCYGSSQNWALAFSASLIPGGICRWGGKGHKASGGGIYEGATPEGSCPSPALSTEEIWGDPLLTDRADAAVWCCLITCMSQVMTNEIPRG